MSNEIEFDKQKLNKLRKLHAEAVKEGKESFLFEGKELLTAYAKYLIQYLETIVNN